MNYGEYLGNSILVEEKKNKFTVLHVLCYKGDYLVIMTNSSCIGLNYFRGMVLFCRAGRQIVHEARSGGLCSRAH